MAKRILQLSLACLLVACAGDDASMHVERLHVAALRAAPETLVRTTTSPHFRWVDLPDGARAPALVGRRFDFATRVEQVAETTLRARYALLSEGDDEPPGGAVFRVILHSIPDGANETVWEGSLDVPDVAELELALPTRWLSAAWVSLEAEVLGASRGVLAAWADPVLERRHAPPGIAAPGATPVVLLTLDTTRQDVLGAYGGPASTPALDSLARGGVLLRGAYSVAFGTTPSHASLLTAKPAALHGVYKNDHVLADAHQTLAETLHAAGYRTAALVGAAPLARGVGLAQGFDVYDDVLVRDAASDLGSYSAVERRAAVTIDRALAWLDEILAADPSAPFFLWLHFYDPHQPYAPPGETADAPPFRVDGEPRFVEPRKDEALARWLAEDPRRVEEIEAAAWARYVAEVEAMDRQIARLFDHLETRHVFDRALVAAIADHGESFGEHGPRLAFDHTALLSTISHLPLLLKLPGGLHAGTARDFLVGNVDLAPTLVEILGLEVPASWAGRSFRARLDGATEDRFRPHLALESANRHAVSVRTRQWMTREVVEEFRDQPHILDYLGYAPGEPEELYDLVADPAERINLHGAEPEDAPLEELESVRQQLLVLRGKLGESESVESRAHREALRALGYVD